MPADLHDRSHHGSGIFPFGSNSLVVTSRSCHQSPEFLLVVVDTKPEAMLLGQNYRLLGERS